MVRSLDAELTDLRGAAEERARREDFLRFQVDEIDAVELRENELPELESEHRRLAYSEQLREEGGLSLAALSGDEHGDASGALDLLARAQRGVDGLAKMDSDLISLPDNVKVLDFHSHNTCATGQ